MIVQYILKSFSRHKARTAIMVLALLVVTTMLVALNNGIESFQQQVVEIIEQEAGEQDITITRADTSINQYIDVERIVPLLSQVDPMVEAIYPRFLATIELESDTQKGNASLVARTPEDDMGQVTVLEGEYDLEGDQVVILKVTADTFGLQVGDEVALSYILPLARVKGQELPTDASVGRITRRFTVRGIALAGGLGGGMQNGVLASVETVQDWLGIPGRAERLVVKLNEGVYSSLNTQNAIFRVRRIAEKMYNALGDDVETYTFSIDKAEMLDFSDVFFAVMRSLSAVYGLLIMGVVGLLIYSIVNTNVEERRRDLAFLRVLGAKRRHLFALVMIEVALIGVMGVGLGGAAGQVISASVVDPIANRLIAQATDAGLELGIEFHMAITAVAIVRAVIIAAVVLTLAAVAPARKAANTKIRYAINPGSAEQLQIEDLSRLRSRKFDVRVIVAGIVLTIMWLLIFIGNNFLFVQGNESVISIFLFTGMALLVIGVSLLFYALTIPFERLLILFNQVVTPKLTFFAGPNLLRAKQRNTIISLMIVFSATLPTFLGTMTALEEKNYDIEARFDQGAPITAEVSRWWQYYYFAPSQEHEYLLPTVLEEIRSLSGIAQAVGLTSKYRADASNKVALRTTAIQVVGVTDSLDGVVYDDLTEYAAVGPSAFDTILSQPDTIILGAGYAEYMDLHVGDVIRVVGEGKDHIVDMRVVGLVEKMAGFKEFSRNENYVRWGRSPAFVSLDTYIRLTTDPAKRAVCATGLCSQSEREQPIMARILMTTEAEADEPQVVADLRELFADRQDVWVESTAEEIRTTEQSMRTVRVLMLIMTVLSFITSVFGVFAVVYVAVYVRRLEIGMLKAIGMRQRELIGSFALEAVIMTVSAALTGVTAGTVLGYIFYVSNNMMRNTPTQLTFDWLTTTAILVMVVLASIISATLAARSVVRSKVTEILREAW